MARTLPHPLHPDDYLGPVHPGTVLLEDFLRPADLTLTQLAEASGISLPTLSQIVRERRSVTADSALRLAGALGTTAMFWLNLQAKHDIEAVAADVAGVQRLAMG